MIARANIGVPVQKFRCQQFGHEVFKVLVHGSPAHGSAHSAVDLANQTRRQDLMRRQIDSSTLYVTKFMYVRTYRQLKQTLTRTHGCHQKFLQDSRRRHDCQLKKVSCCAPKVEN